MRRSRWYAGISGAILASALAVSGIGIADATTTKGAQPARTTAATLAAAAAATGYQPLDPSPCGTMTSDDGLAHQINHVIWVVFENKARPVIFGDATKDPYLGGLALACGQATAYQSTPYFPAKLAMASGSDWGLTKDAAPVPGPDIYSQLGTDWMQYMGGMPSNCFGTNTKDHLYLAAHNAAAYFLDNTAACATQDVPLPSTPAGLDLSHKYTFIEANVPQSMHGCNKICGKNKWAQLAMGDVWARTWVDALVETPQYLSGDTVIFVLWDQGNTVTNNTAFITVSPYTTPGSVSTIPYDHYSLLRGTQDLLGLEPLGHAADAGTNSVANDFELPYPAVVPPPPPDPGAPALQRVH